MNINKQFLTYYLMWLLPVSFFAFQFILRLLPSLIMPQIFSKFAIDATAFGVLASFYYYGYSGCQIPCAILLDKFNPRYVIALCAAICGIGTLIFNFTDQWYLMLISRLLVGAGSAAGFLGISKITSIYFKEHYTRMIGLSFTLGLTGAIYGGRPINMLIDRFNWNNVTFTLGLVSFAIGLAILFFLRVKINNKPSEMVSPILSLQDFLGLLKSPLLWLLAIANLLMVGILEGFSDVWGVNYLITAYSFSKEQSASLTSFIFLGMIFGGPVLAFLARLYSDYIVVISSGLLMSLLFFILLIFPQYFTYFSIASLFFILGILCCYQVIIFSIGANLVREELLGITIAFLNCINMLGGSYFHTAIGCIMDKFWTGNLQNNTKIYDLISYKFALAIIPASALIGGMLLILLKFLNKPILARK